MENTRGRYEHTGEVSLVELAATFIRRRIIFYVSFIFITLLGIVYALMQPDRYQFVTLLESAQRADGEYIEKPAASIATFQNRWIPDAISSYRAMNDSKPPFGLVVANPESTGLIQLKTEAAVEHQELLKTMHQNLADQFIQRQQSLLKKYKEGLNGQVASMETVIETLKSSGNDTSSGPALAAAIQKRAELQRELEGVVPAGVLVLGRKSIDQTGTSSALIVALASVLGVMFGVFFAFFAEFVARVRESLHQSSEEVKGA